MRCRASERTSRPAGIKRLVLVGLLLGILLVVGLLPGGLVLRITSVADNRPVLVLPLLPGERFTIRYYHSVENAPIWEVHSVDATGQLFIEEERYLKFGAGMGRMPGIGRMVRRGKFEVIEDMHMPTGNFILRVGSPGVDHTIIWRGVEKNLSAMVPHQAVTFAARKVTLAFRVWRGIFPHDKTPQSKGPEKTPL